MKKPAIIEADVIVIGSGPGGIAAAITCARAGLQVIIVGAKPVVAGKNLHYPSESLHPGAATLLNELQITTALEGAAVGKYKGIQVNGQFTSLGSDESGHWEGTHISRQIFDAALLAAATQRSIQVITDTVTGILKHEDRVAGVTTRGGSHVHARFVIDGSGRKRLAGKKMKFREDVFSPPLVAWSGVAQCNAGDEFSKDRARFIPSETGWTWLAPHLDDRCTWTRLSITHQEKLMPPTELDGCTQLGNIHSANMQWRMFRPACTEGLLLIGDAAAIIDPAAGQGILNALWSGIYAGKTVVSCMRNAPYESFYLAAFDQWSVERYRERVESLRKLYALHGIKIISFAKERSVQNK